MLENTVYGMGGDPSQIYRMSLREDASIEPNSRFILNNPEVNSSVLYTDYIKTNALPQIVAQTYNNIGAFINSIPIIVSDILVISTNIGTIVNTSSMIDAAIDHR